MGKGGGWWGLRRDSGGGKSLAPRFPDDPDDEQLCGVGVVLFKAPDNSLFVKVGFGACPDRMVDVAVLPLVPSFALAFLSSGCYS
jgi:hypothetical protein